MNDLTLPYHLIIPAFISFLALATIFLKRNFLFKTRKWKWFWISTTVLFSLYFLIVSVAAYADVHAQWDLNRYDLNKDGLFSGSEITAEQEAAMQNLVADTGRNFAFITGFILSAFVAILVLVMGQLIDYLKNKSSYQE